MSSGTFERRPLGARTDDPGNRATDPVPDLKTTVQMIRDGRAAEVRPALEALVAKDPFNVAVRAALAMAYEADDLLEESVSAWRSAWSMAPDSPAVSEGLRRALRARLLHRHRAEIATAADFLARVTPVGGDGPATPAPPDEPAPPAGAEVALEEPEAPEPDQAQVEAAAEPLPDDSAPPPVPVPPVWQPMDEPITEPIAEPVPALSAPDSPAADLPRDDGDLDELIRELESARIVPDPNVRPVDVKTIEPDVEDVVSETLARIYSNQRFYEEAAAVYEKLAAQQPARAEEFRRKAADIRGRITR